MTSRRGCKILPILVALLFLATPVLSVIPDLSDEADAIYIDGPVSDNVIGRGLNLLKDDINDIDVTLKIGKNNIFTDVEDIVRTYDTAFEEKTEDYSKDVHEYSNSLGMTFGVELGTKAGVGPFYAGVSNLTEVGFNLKQTNAKSYEFYSKTWSIRTDAVVLTVIDPEYLSQRLTLAFNKDCMDMENRLENGNLSDNDIAKFFDKYGTHINLGYYNGGTSTTSVMFLSEMTSAELDNFVKNTTTITEGIGKEPLYVETNQSFSTELHTANSSEHESVKYTRSCVTIGGNSAFGSNGNYSTENDIAWANSVKLGKSPAIVGFADDHLVPVWEFLTENPKLSMMLERYFYRSMNENYFEFCKDLKLDQKKDLSACVYEILDGDVLVNSPIVNSSDYNKDKEIPGMIQGKSGIICTDVNKAGYTASSLLYEVIEGAGNLVDGKINIDGTFKLRDDATGSVKVLISSQIDGLMYDTCCVEFTTMSQRTYGFDGGNGTEKNPFLISSWDTLKKIENTITEKNLYYKLTRSLEWTGGNWVPIGTADNPSGCTPFEGVFDGGHYTLSKLTMNNKLSRNTLVGVFACVGSGTVKNLNVTDVDFKFDARSAPYRSMQNIGVIAGNLGTGTISDCHTSGHIYFGAADMNGAFGGIAGSISHSAAKISGCSSSVNIEAHCMKCHAGGIVGHAQEGSIEDCSVDSHIKTRAWCRFKWFQSDDGVCVAGGVAGYVQSAKISTCIVTGEVGISGNSIGPEGCGGIAGLVGDRKCAPANSYYNVNDVFSHKKITGYAGNRGHNSTVFDVSAWNQTYDFDIWDRNVWSILDSKRPVLNTPAGLREPLPELTSQTGYLKGEFYNPYNLAGPDPIKINISTSDGKYISVPVEFAKYDRDLMRVYVSAYGATGYYDLDLVENSPVEMVIGALPDKLVYSEGDAFDYQGMKVIVKHVDGKLVDVTSDPKLTKIVRPDRVGDVPVTLSYTDQGVTVTSSFYFKVNAKPQVSNLVSFECPDYEMNLLYSTVDADGNESTNLYYYTKPFVLDEGSSIKLDYSEQMVPIFSKFMMWVCNGEVHKEPVVTVTPNGPLEILLIIDSPAISFNSSSFGFLNTEKNMKFFENDSMVLPQDVFNKLERGEYTISVYSDKSQYTWNFSKSMAPFNSDLRLNVDVDRICNTPDYASFEKQFPGMGNATRLDFDMSGKVPSGTVVSVNTGDMTPGERFNLYHYDQVKSQWVYQNRDCTVASDGTVSLPIEHCSTYALAPTYTVKWVDYDGTVLETDSSVLHGEMPSYDGVLPEKDTLDGTIHPFKGWYPALSEVTGDITYTAQYYDSKYNITWKNYDGSVLRTESAAFDTMPVYTGSVPVKPPSSEFQYVFSGWSPAIVKVSEDATYTAQFNAEDRKYAITWKNYDGTVLGYDESLSIGMFPNYNGSMPVRDSDAQFSYAFSGWYPELSAVKQDTVYTAKYNSAVRSYPVIWQNYDGTVMERDAAVKYGEIPVYNGGVPEKPGDARHSYEFTGWSPYVGAVSGETVYTAEFKTVDTLYTVRWVDSNGILLYSSDFKYGEHPIYNGSVPIKAETSEATYTFSGWFPRVVNVTDSVTYTAMFSGEKKSYPVTWMNYDGKVLMTDSERYGDIPVYYGMYPVKPDTVQYSYVFSGWSPKVEPVTEKTSYVAVFVEKAREYSVFWENWNGNILENDNNVEYGTTPVFNGAVPTKPADAEFTYTFSGWSPSVGNISGDTIFVAQFDAVKNKYPVIWKNWNGDVLERDNSVIYGSIPEYDGDVPTRPSDAEFKYTFSGWSPSVREVTGNAVYTAKFHVEKNTYQVTWRNWDGSQLEVDTNVEYGTLPSFDGSYPKRSADAEFTYNFIGWSPEVGPVTGKTVYIAQFSEVKNTYTVVWRNYNNEILLINNSVEYGTMPMYTGATPVKESTTSDYYVFIGWSPEVTKVTGDASYIAKFHTASNTYTITWANYDGSVLEMDLDMKYGSSPMYNGPTPQRTDSSGSEYVFAGWSPSVSVVTDNATYTATYERLPASSVDSDDDGGHDSNTLVYVASAGIGAIVVLLIVLVLRRR